jgi:hypothetical protein
MYTYTHRHTCTLAYVQYIVKNPDPEFRSSGKVQNAARHCSATLALQITTNVKVKVKVKLTLEQATKAQRGSTGTAVLFL